MINPEKILGAVELVLRFWSETLPLEVFVFVGSLVEEVVSPIPSTVILSFSGSMANALGYTVFGLAGLSFVANLGKTIGALGYYFLGDKLEDVVVHRFGRYLGISRRDVESLGRRFTGHWKDTVILFFLRLLPFVPTTPVSIACGVIRMNLRAYIFATFSGNFIKDFGYLLIGYYGLSALRELFDAALDLNHFVNLAIFIGSVCFFWILWYHRRKGYWFWQWCQGRCGNFFRKFKVKISNIKSILKSK